jgi:hypothetical protein
MGSILTVKIKPTLTLPVDINVLCLCITIINVVMIITTILCFKTNEGGRNVTLIILIEEYIMMPDKDQDK